MSDENGNSAEDDTPVPPALFKEARDIGETNVELIYTALREMGQRLETVHRHVMNLEMKIERNRKDAEARSAASKKELLEAIRGLAARP